MKFINFYKNKWNLIILILSLISLVPCYFFYINAKQLSDLQDITHANDAMIEDTLSKGLNNIHILIPFLIGITVWVVNATISGYAVAKKLIRPSYGYITVFLGGLGIHLIASFLFLIPLKRKDSTKLSRKIWLSTGASLGVAATVVPCVLMIGPKSFNDASVGKPIMMSFNKDNPNLIEVFTDGFDLHNSDNAKMFTENPEYRDFTFINHFMSVGHPTHLSMPMVYGSFENNNPFVLLKKYGTDFNGYMDKVYSDGYIQAGKEHFADSSTNPTFSSINLVNPINFSDKVSYGSDVAGVPEAIKQAIPGIQVTNWSGVRDSLVSPWGITTKSPDSNSYDWLSKNMIASDQTKGARVLIQDLLTHRPFMNDGANDRLTLFNFSLTDQQKLLNAKLSELIDALRNVKNPRVNDPSFDQTKETTNAYDNSLIMIYGDHASHDFMPEDNFPEQANARKTESALFIKYPGDKAASDNSNIKILSDRYVWGPQINHIISNYFASPRQDAWNYIKTDSAFDNVERPIFGSPTEYIMAKWDGDEVKPALDSNNKVQKVIWSQDPVEQQKQIDALKGVKY